MSLSKRARKILAVSAIALGVGTTVFVVNNNHVSLFQETQQAKPSKHNSVKTDTKKVVPNNYDVLSYREIEKEKAIRFKQAAAAKKAAAEQAAKKAAAEQAAKKAAAEQAAKDAAAKAEAARVAAAKDAAAKAEIARRNQVASSNQSSNSASSSTGTTQSSSRNNSYNNNSGRSSSYTAPAARTYPFTINGRGFNVYSLSGSGRCPAGPVYKWTDLPNYYLADAAGASGAAARTLYIGAPIKIGSATYHVTSIMQHVSASHDFDRVAPVSAKHRGSLQTCIGSSENMNVYFFD
jgi:hypothetical protein